MLYILINRTKPGLTAEQYSELGQMAQAFYDNVPQGITLRGDWAANDGTRTFAMLETDDAELLETIHEPFRHFVDIEVVPVTPISGWTRR